jgi:hypothetical protein
MESETTHSLSKGQKIALGVALVWLLFCLTGGFIDSWYLLIVVCIALMAAIFCLFMRQLDAKYGWAVFATSLIIPFVIIGVMANTDKNTTEQTVEKKAEPNTTDKSGSTKESSKDKSEKEKQEPKLSPKEQAVANAGYKKGSMYGMARASNEEFSNMLDLADYVDGMDDKVTEMFEQLAGDEYDREYHAPTNAEEKKLKKIYIEHFIEAMNGTMDTMDNLEKLGGKRNSKQ